MTIIRISLSLLCLLLCIAPSVRAQFVDPQNVLIKNVHIVDGDTEDALVNVLIRNNKLELVTKDDVPVEDPVVAVDGNGGYLLGTLSVGDEPSFIILDKDPRQDFDVLLDTESHAIFAVHAGVLRKNNLFEATAEPVAQKRPLQGPGWLAYSPPPMAMPTAYLDTTKWNRWESKWVDGIFIAAVVLDRQRWISQNNDSEQQVGDLSQFDGGEIRGFRLGAAGTINLKTPWVYTIAAATNAFDKGFERESQDELTFFDWRLDIPVFDDITLSVGKQKEPISMERVMSMVQLPMQERTSVSDAMLPSRNVGAVLSSTAFNQRVTWAGGIFNDWIETGGSFSNSATQLIGRGTWLPYISEDESNLVHVGIGYRYSNANEGVQFLTEPEFNKSPLFVDTGLIDARALNQLNLEASWRLGPYWLAYEYVGNDVDSRADGNLDFTGWHLTGSWILSGEMRSYNRNVGILGPVPVARSVYQGGWGAWEVSARYSSIDLTDGPVDGGEMDILSLGLNWWLTPIFNVNMNYRYIWNDWRGFDGKASGINARVVLMLE